MRTTYELVQGIVEFVGSELIDLARVADTATAGVAAISVQNDAYVARHRSLLELTQEPMFVNPIERSQQSRRRKRFSVDSALQSRLVLDQGRAHRF